MFLGARLWSASLASWANGVILLQNLNRIKPIRTFDDMGELVIDEVMNPGDILYIPARMSHYGVAKMIA